MNRRSADRFVGTLVAAVMVGGGALSWQAYRSRQSADTMGSMMGRQMGSVHGTDPLWYVLGTLLLSGLVLGFYLAIRDDLPVPDAEDESRTTPGDRTEPHGTAPAPPDKPDDATAPPEASAQERVRILDLLPEDERRILEPVLRSPGLTQIELRDRADFSKSKVSQTVSDLEKRGLLYRERQGRTYRVYPSEELDPETASPTHD